MSSRSQSRSRSPRRRYYPRKNYTNPAEIAMFEKIIQGLKAYSADQMQKQTVWIKQNVVGPGNPS